MRVALTGTPGTGKTSTAKEIEGFEIVDLREFALENNIGEKKEELEIDVSELRDAFEASTKTDKDLLFEGHFAHYLSADLCIVLRCEPEELRKRLNGRGYSDDKIEENVEAEKIDLTLQEAVEIQENVLEIDTTGRTAEGVAKELQNRIEEKETGYGKVDWTESI